MTTEEVEFCGCTNEELEAGRTCGQGSCPNKTRHDVPADPMLGTPRDGRHPDHQCGQQPCPHIPARAAGAAPEPRRCSCPHPPHEGWCPGRGGMDDPCSCYVTADAPGRMAELRAAVGALPTTYFDRTTGTSMVSRAAVLALMDRPHASTTPSPSNCVEFITDDGKRYAWSESNVQYEEVSEDGASFTLLRKRLARAEELLEEARSGLRTQAPDSAT